MKEMNIMNRLSGNDITVYSLKYTNTDSTVKLCMLLSMADNNIRHFIPPIYRQMKLKAKDCSNFNYIK